MGLVAVGEGQVGEAPAEPELSGSAELPERIMRLELVSQQHIALLSCAGPCVLVQVLLFHLPYLLPAAEFHVFCSLPKVSLADDFGRALEGGSYDIIRLFTLM